MALVRIISMGVGPHGGKIKPSATPIEWSGPLGSWMELVEGEAPSSPPAPAAAPSKIAEAPAAETQSTEAAGDEPAESKRQLRGRKLAQKETE